MTFLAPSRAGTADSDDLATFGYSQELHRSLGSYASFAAGFSFVSILMTIFQLFAFGFSFGGASFFWTWPIVFAGQILVALCFAELAARYPISGAIYHWSQRLANPTWGWFAGWIMIVAQICTVAAAAIALQVTLPQIWSGFQLVGHDTAVTSPSGAQNAVILGMCLVAATTAVNAAGVRMMARLNQIGVTCELIGVTLLVVLLFTHAHRGPAVVTHHTGASPSSSYLAAFVVSALMAAYVMVGFDSAGELSEETREPRRLAPRAILRALGVSFVGGALLLLAALMAAPSLTDGKLASIGLPYVLLSDLGGVVGRIFLIGVAIAVCSCTLAIQTAGMRMIFSMARDGRLPASSALAKINPRTRTPILPGILIGVLVVALLFVNLGDASVFLALSSVCIAMLYIAYLMVTGPMLYRRLRGEWRPSDDGTFSLGRAGIAVNLVAVLYGAAMTVNLAWPRASVYDAGGGHWYLQWFAPLFIAGALLVGVAAFLRQRAQAAPARSAPAPAVGEADVTSGMEVGPA